LLVNNWYHAKFDRSAAPFWQPKPRQQLSQLGNYGRSKRLAVFIEAGANSFREDMMKASSLSFQAAVLFVIAGMLWGIQMAMSQDHSAFPAHAHLNLLGWVSLFLFGIYYFLHPALDRGKTAKIQVCIWIIGTIIMTIGVAFVHTGRAGGDPIAALGSLIVLADTLLFGWLVFKTERSAAA
jgi:peptidoglycan/LPS O-acetylase OafA/YrhL